MRIDAISRFFIGLIFIILLIFCQTAISGDAPQVTTDKDLYNGETIKVSFFNSPGKADDWICIVPVGSPDTDGGDYKYMPKGLIQGVLTFDSPIPGKYEVRAYYNYKRNGYVVSARHTFSVAGGADYEKMVAERMERMIDPNNPLENTVPPGNGLVYILWEPSFVSASFEVQIIADGKPIVIIPNSSYFLFSAPAGDINFKSGIIRNITPKSEETTSVRECKATIKVKSGYVYYLKLRMIPLPFWALFLDHVPHQEGANLIQNSKMTQLK